MILYQYKVIYPSSKHFLKLVIYSLFCPSQWEPSPVYFISKAIAVKQGKYRLFGALFLCCTAASATSLYITNIAIYLRNNESKSYTDSFSSLITNFIAILVSVGNFVLRFWCVVRAWTRSFGGTWVRFLNNFVSARCFLLALYALWTCFYFCNLRLKKRRK